MVLIKCLISALLALTSSSQLTAQNKLEMKDEQPIEFQGELEIGKRYVAAIETGDKSLSFQPVERLRMPMHHAGRIEWINLAGLGILHSLSGSRETKFIFEVVSKEIVFRAMGSWTTTYFCRILEIKTDDKDFGAQHYKAFVFVGKCRDIFPTGKRHQSYVFNFEILRIIANGESITGKRNVDFKLAAAQRKITFERFAGLGGDELLINLGGNDLINKLNSSGKNAEKFDWDSEKEIEVTILFVVNERE